MPLPTGFVEARWVPVWSADLPDGPVHPGDVRVVPAGEAEGSNHWEPVLKAAKPSGPVKITEKDAASRTA